MKKLEKSFQVCKVTYLIIFMAFMVILTGCRPRFTSDPVCLNSMVRGNTIKIGAKRFSILLIDTKDNGPNGIFECNHLARNCGVVYLYNEMDEQPFFWMRGMNFPVDAIWIREGRVIRISSNIPPIPEEGANELMAPLYSISDPVDAVLQINAGEAQRCHLRVGDLVEYNLI